MTAIVEQRVAMETSQHSKDDELWTVYVDDLWSIALPHLREKGLYAIYIITDALCIKLCMYVCTYI